MEPSQRLNAIGFKEWSSVCAALGAGRQRILIRKGGIAEGKAGFAFRHSGFFLFPTLFHQQEALIREPFSDKELPAPGEQIPISFYATLLACGELRDWKAVETLKPRHIWDENVIRERFFHGDAAKEGSVQVAVVQVWKLPATWWIADHQRYGGCRSWVELPEPDDATRTIGSLGCVSAGAAAGTAAELVELLGKHGRNVSVAV